MTTTVYDSLDALLADAIDDDTWEEDAADFLHDHRIPIASHSRSYTLTRAWSHGWRPGLDA